MTTESKTTETTIRRRTRQIRTTVLPILLDSPMRSHLGLPRLKAVPICEASIKLAAVYAACSDGGLNISGPLSDDRLAAELKLSLGGLMRSGDYGVLLIGQTSVSVGHGSPCWRR